MRKAGLLGLAALSLSSCLYTNVHTPRAYRSATPLDVKPTAADETVSGQVCAYSVLFLVSWGNAGYAAATRKALERHPDAILYDVKSDAHVTAYLLGLYTRVCTVVTGKAGAAERPEPAAPGTPVVPTPPTPGGGKP